MTDNEWKYRLIVLSTVSDLKYFIQIAKYDKIRSHSVWLRVLGLLETRDIILKLEGEAPV